MTPDHDIFPSLGSTLNARFRGFAERDWDEWRARHFFPSAADIPDDAERVLLGREDKHSMRGLGAKKAIRHLIVGIVNQAGLEEIGQLASLERLELGYALTAEDPAPLLALQRLRFLSIDSPRKIADFSPLLRLPSLRTLIIENARRMLDLEWLRAPNRLEVLGIEGAMDTPARIPSLGPLAGHPTLQAFLGTSIRLEDKDLTPLASCPALRFIGMARAAPREEYERLAAARPDIYCDWFRPEMWKSAGLRAAR